MPRYKIIAEVEVEISGGTENTRNDFAKEITTGAIIDGFAYWLENREELLTQYDPKGDCHCDEGWILGKYNDDPCPQCDDGKRKRKSLSNDAEYSWNIKRVTRINKNTKK
tara:strand:- start:560 stop:889 length:330 start_codon:yes stop_codon:yes gene_type:complete